MAVKMMTKKFDQLLDNTYYSKDSPAFMAGQVAVLREAKKTEKSVRLAHVVEYLHRQDAYTIHKPLRRRFPRNKVVPIWLHTDWACDLVDVASIARHNDGHTFILTVKDMLSRYCWAQPLKNKKPETVVDAFRIIVDEAPRVCWRLFSDKGTEFCGKPMQDFLAALDIQHITPATPDTKIGPIENMNRVLKRKLWKMFTKERHHRWIDSLQQVVTGMNNSHCRAINARPVDITPENADALWKRLYGHYMQRGAEKPHSGLQPGTWVRIAKYKNIFSKEYVGNFTEERFKITNVLDRRPPVYMIEDYNGTPIKGTYYSYELVPVVQDSETVYLIDRIVRKKRTKTGDQLLVDWVGYGPDFRSWIQASELVTNA